MEIAFDPFRTEDVAFLIGFKYQQDLGHAGPGSYFRYPPPKACYMERYRVHLGKKT